MDINEVLSSLEKVFVATNKGLIIYEINTNNKSIKYN